MNLHKSLDQRPLILQALSHHPFRHLWVGQLFSQIGASMLLSILALRIYELTRSNTAVSALYVAYAVPAVVFGMLAGAMVDHMDKRKVLAFCNISRAILIVALFFFPEHLPIVYTIMFINSLVSQFYLPAEAPLIPRLVPDRLVLSANSLFSFTFFASIAIGFVLAGPALRYLGAYGSFAILLLFYVIAVWSVSRIPKQNEKLIGFFMMIRKYGVHFFRMLLSDVKKGMKFSLTHKHIFDALILLTAAQIVLAILGTLGPGFADQVLHIQVTDASMIILGPSVLGIILGALWVGNYGAKYSMKRLTTFGLLFGGTFLVLIASLIRFESTTMFGDFFSTPSMFFLTILLFFALGVSNSFLDVPSNATLQRESDETMRSRIYGIVTALGGGVGIIPVLAGGILADSLGVGKVLLGLGCAIFVYGVWRLRTLF